MEFKITIDQFEGPLDLMLHLIKENKLDLFDLDMLILADQYIHYIHQMEDMHLEVASEYLIELSSLIEYKSRKLLPREEVVVDDDYEEVERNRLVSRLLEYQKFKEVTMELKDSYEKRQLHYTRPQASMASQWSIPIQQDQLSMQSPYELMKAMNRVIQRKILLEPYETKVTIKEMSLEDRRAMILPRIQALNGPIFFDDLCDDCTDLHMLIVTFLAVLDLIYQKKLTFTLTDDDKIVLRKDDTL